MKTSSLGFIACCAAAAFAACSGHHSSAPPCSLAGATPVEHSNSPTANETWATGVHHVSSSLVIPSGVTLTVAPCAEVRLDADINLDISGTLKANGASGQPITFVSTNAGTPWGAIKLSPNSTAELAYATLTGGGGSLGISSNGTIGATIYAQGTGDPVPADLKVDHVDVEQSTGIGVAMVHSAFTADSTALTVHAAGDAAVYMGADVVDTLPTGTYTGNGRDLIALQTAFAAADGNQRDITRDLTIHDRGVPYCVGLNDSGEIRVKGVGSAPLVTIEAGVTMLFTHGVGGAGRLTVEGDNGPNPTAALGAISAVGTAAKPIVFGSCEAAPAAGDWIGLQFTGIDSRTQLSHVAIHDAGADSGVVGVCDTNPGGATSPKDGDAALQIFFSQGAPASSFFSNSVIDTSAASGIYRGWHAASPADFLSGNQVSGVAFCTQTNVPDLSNACPVSACPTG